MTTSDKDDGFDFVLRLAQAILGNQSDIEADDFLKGPLLKPQYIVAPGEDDLPHAPLKIIYRYWRDMEKVDGVAQSMRVEPTAIKGALGYLMLLDVLDGGRDYYYSLYGTRIAECSGFDMTGRKLTSLPSTSVIRTFFHATYAAALEARTPIFATHNAPDNIMVGRWHRLILPMGEASEVKRLLVCNIPIAHDGKRK